MRALSSLSSMPLRAAMMTAKLGRSAGICTRVLAVSGLVYVVCCAALSGVLVHLLTTLSLTNPPGSWS